MKRDIRGLLRSIRLGMSISIALLLVIFGIWCVGAVHYGIHFPFASVLFLLLLFGGIAAGFRWRWLFLLPTVLELAVMTYFIVLTPEDVFRDVVWQPSWARRPTVGAEEAGKVRIANIRDFHYRSEKEFDRVYVDGEYPIGEAVTLDVAVSHWDGLEKIAHTMLSFGFFDGRYLALSMETRLPEGVEQGFIPGLYKQYEILNIFATEEDLYQLRTDFRGEELFLYRTNATPEQVQKLFRAVLLATRRLEKEPHFYNSLTVNCTTSLAPLLGIFSPASKKDIRLLLNGLSDELLFELGYLAARDGESFEELKKRRKVNQYLPGDPAKSYSERIRTNL